MCALNIRGTTALLTVILAAAPRETLATDFTWNAPAGGLFHAPINWTPFQFQPPIVGPPGPGEMATYAISGGNGNYTVTFGTNPTNTRCRIGDDHVLFDLAGHTYTLTSTTDKSLTLAGITFFDDARLTLTNGTLVGDDAAIAASNFSNAAQLVVGSGATLSLDDLSVGMRDAGSMIVQSGGHASCYRALLGELNDASGANGNGSVTVSGAGSTWNIGWRVFIGTAGNGSLNINSGGAVAADDAVYAGYGPGTTASITVTGPGSQLLSHEYGAFGYSGNATINISDGAHVALNNVMHTPPLISVLGWQAGSIANVTVTGSGSSLTFGGGVAVGSFGEGHLTLSNGATGSSFNGIFGDTRIAYGDGGTGSMLVSGEGSAWNAGHTLSVGQGGTGFCTINAGADVVGESIRIGAYSLYTPVGTLTVDGPGSTLSSTVDFTIGGTNTGPPEGDGTLIISNGATVTHQALNLPEILVHAGSDIILNNGTITTPQVRVHGGLSGKGTINANVISDGMVAPGNSPGLLTINGGYTQQAAGAVNIEIGGAAPGTQHDQLLVSGNVTLGGTINVTLINAFTPHPGDQFVIIRSTGGAITGTFASVIAPPGWSVLYTPSAVTLAVADPCPADIAPLPAGNGQVNVDDLLAVITSWGACPLPCPPRCAADIAPAGGNCAVNVDDLLMVITHWGVCP